MTAEELLNSVPDPRELVGRWIMTVGVGEYPGGLAEITAIVPDENAPEIPFQVRNPLFASDENPLGEIGVFEWEYVQLIDQAIQMTTHPCVVELPQACLCN